MATSFNTRTEAAYRVAGQALVARDLSLPIFKMTILAPPGRPARYGAIEVGMSTDRFGVENLARAALGKLPSALKDSDAAPISTAQAMLVLGAVIGANLGKRIVATRPRGGMAKINFSDCLGIDEHDEHFRRACNNMLSLSRSHEGDEADPEHAMTIMEPLLLKVRDVLLPNIPLLDQLALLLIEEQTVAGFENAEAAIKAAGQRIAEVERGERTGVTIAQYQ